MDRTSLVTEYTHHQKLTKLDNFQLWCHREWLYLSISIACVVIVIPLSLSLFIYLSFPPFNYVKCIVRQGMCEWAHVLTRNFHSKPENLKWCFLFYRNKKKSNEIVVTLFLSSLIEMISSLRSMFACESVCVLGMSCCSENFSEFVANQPFSFFFSLAS